MSAPAQNGPRWRAHPFTRASASPSPTQSTMQPSGHARSKSTFASPASPPITSGGGGGMVHQRTQSFSPGPNSLVPARSDSLRRSARGSTPQTGTFAPTFIKTEEGHDALPAVERIEGENDFSGKRYVWLRDATHAFVKGWVVQELEAGRLLVQCDDGSQREVQEEEVDKVNPAKFDKADDMAELTHLNEPSVVHNLRMRYQADLIYTYSGLFLVTINPYCPLPIYSRDYINMYRGRSREDTKPHIFAMADEAFRNLVEEGDNQSILVTGESGAGKTENTKKVIQYLAAVATSDTPRAAKSGAKSTSNLSEQILRANPILEAFGNAQTVRNNNSSRFGKFIRIEFTRSGQISGAYIDWYLLEKSRVVKLNSMERNYHVFYQLLRGADKHIKDNLLLSGRDIEDFEYTRQGNDTIAGVSDQDEWNTLVEAFHIMGFEEREQMDILRTIAAILYLGNITVRKESLRGDQAAMDPDAESQAAIACRLLGIPTEAFIMGLLHPRVKAGREWVEKTQTPEQVKLAIDALAKGIYERGFGDLVTRINRQLDRSAAGVDDSHFIGVLDIAGFEIFEHNSFEQLCINYTNEKLQQFFNHHMFVLEQEEYAREQIEWKFIDFGKDLQPTIDLIELSNPIGLFSCLDEDSVMPKATDASFTEKMHSLWEKKSNKYKRSLLQKGFIITHYAAEVEYSTDGWLEKNKDPLPDNITRLLAASTEKHIAELFSDCADPDDDTGGGGRSRVKKGLFRTVAQRHKEQLSTLMSQLHSTHPHFVRCILPNHKKKPKQFSPPLVLDQLRCNGVLEGIRIARTGFPNRLPFAEFRARYEVLCSTDMPKQYLEGQVAAQLILEKLGMDKAFYRVGLTKVFFRAGVLAELEDRRDRLISEIMCQFQSIARGFVQRRMAHKKLYRAEATRVIQRNFQVYLDLQANPWWRLFVRMKPLLGATRQAAEMKKRDEMILKLEEKVKAELTDKQRLDEERRRAEIEIQKIQHTLESERALALDKEEIFKRLQLREAELAEKLQGAIEDQERLEDQLDALADAKKKVDSEAEGYRRQLEQAGEIIERLEKEKEDLSRQLNNLENQLRELETAKSQRTELEESLSQEVRMLSSQLSLKERKLQDLEAKLLKSDQELDVKLAASNKEVAASKKQIRDLLDENRQIRQQITELSSTSTSFEELIRRKDSELALLKSDLKKYESERKIFENEKKTLSSKHESIQERLRDAQAEMEGLRVQKSQIEREAADTKRMLEERITNDQSRKLLERQIEELREELVQVQKDLARERQSRDDVEMLSEHKYKNLKEEYDSLNEAKIIIEKELYAQQDVLRRATEARTAAEKERKEYQTELRNLREKYIQLQEEKLNAQETADRAAQKIASERQAAMRKELDAKNRQLDELHAEKARLVDEVQGLTRMIAESDNFRLSNDQHKERLERELVTVKGRLAASENDNRALLNKLQQKSLDIARSNSRASEQSRARVSQLSNEKAKVEEENKRLQRQVEDLQLQVSSLEKQKEKLSLNLEDLTHEINREHKTSRNAEKLSSTVNLQLAEANRKLETERQLRMQAQSNTRTVQASLDEANKELDICRGQLVLLRKVFDPETTAHGGVDDFETVKSDIEAKVDLAKRLESAESAARTANERLLQMEALLSEMRARHGDEMAEMDARYLDSKRAFLDELNQSQVNARNISPVQYRSRELENRKPFSPNSKPSTPVKQRQLSNATHDSVRSDRTTDTVAISNQMDLASEVEMLQNQLQMSEMRNRHLQAQLDRSPQRQYSQDDSPSLRRMQKLERENFRLHDMLDDSAKKVSHLESSIRSGQLSLKEVQTKSHEELYDLINSQEQSRRSIVKAHDAAVNELVSAKTAFDELKNVRAALEVELRDTKSELQDLKYEREQEKANHAQLLQEFSDLQIRLDTETSNLLDVTSSLNLYKARADEYFSKLEQAEIAVLKATRAEQFAKSQAKETEETCARIMSERKSMDMQVEDLQRTVQQLEERVEDLSADLEGAVQAKKRLQNELEDYRSQRAHDIEDKETIFEQARKKYSNELTALSNELEIERENVVYHREENGRLRDEIEELRAKWDDEVLNSSTWAKEKGRLEVMLQELSTSRDEAVAAHNDAQSKIVNLLGQVRNLRTNVDDISAERDNLLKEKKTLESRLKEQQERLEDLMKGESPSMRNAAAADRDLLELKASLAQQEDIVAAAVGKMRRAEALAQETQRDIQTEREKNVQLHKEKAALEKSVKDLQIKLVDLETKGYSSASGDVRFLNERIKELEQALEAAESARTSEARSIRTVDRTVKDLQSQIERREKQNAMLSEDLNKAREKISNLLKTIDELQTSDSANQLSAKRAERELREAKENALRLERELEGWKALRLERGSRAGSIAHGERLLVPPRGEGSVRSGGSQRENSEGMLRKVSNASRFL
ncbi:uncharacterized protein PV09_04377 [Verruconis gallopava]|uniref:Myosin motor domain-containing protein n=1 Tax=Verruconis gallopava TaxID=253628 RepID=A0A0D1XPZ0_9PEZI|nr:uncharacterized protein PV09_04377 [Verruconis gallopava]KIW04631.1 hypothetical protein PV09_04377 [Verruconis gallopava]